MTLSQLNLLVKVQKKQGFLAVETIAGSQHESNMLALKATGYIAVNNHPAEGHYYCITTKGQDAITKLTKFLYQL